MENRLAEALVRESEVKSTENGDRAFLTTHKACLDLFAVGGSLRSRSEEDILELWKRAEKEDPVTAYTLLFFIRSVRNGYGERRTFRIIWNSLKPELKTRLAYLVPEVGRWDDLEEFILSNSDFAKRVRDNLEYEYGTLDDGQSPSLLAKWLPCGRGNKTARERTRKMAKCLGYREQEYRKIITALRSKLNLVESKMAGNEWTSIDYSKLPSLAGYKHSDAFKRHDPEGYSSYLDKVREGRAKINTSVLSPVDLIRKLRINDPSAEVMWKNLPDYTNGHTGIAVVDVSGSMANCISDKSGLTALDCSVAMGLYFAERNKGPFKDMFITFSDNPKVQLLEGDTEYDRLRVLYTAEWGRSTDLRKALLLILDVAVKNHCSQEELPETLFVFTDMEFDEGTRGSSTFEDVKASYEEAGYKMPSIVFWNLFARNNTFPVQMNEQGVNLVSGYSTLIFNTIMSRKTPYEMMMDTVKSFPYYEEIKKVFLSVSLNG